jgi:rSAM/selenodomain-associated transferase 1
VKTRPALIVFCREPVAGRAKTRLTSHLDPANAAALAHAFLLDTLAKASALRPSRLIIAGTAETPVERGSYFRSLARRFGGQLFDQGQGSLGARMQRALREYCTGPGALLIGTDVPSLSLGALRRLYQLARRRRIVLGPSLDGGYYAIGVRGPLPPIFTGMRWSTASVLARTVARIRRSGETVALGPVWHDVDQWDDLMLLSVFLMRMEASPSAAPHPCPTTAAVMRRLGLLPRRR